jgi:uncharacterized protein (DUF169 family)
MTSFGCIGNRVYTGLTEDELYIVVRGVDMPRIVDALKTIGTANAALQDYAQGRRSQLSTL